MWWSVFIFTLPIYIYIYTVTYTVEGVRINHCFAICTGKREINAPPPLPPFRLPRHQSL